MILTALEFLLLAFCLGLIAGSVIEALVHPRLRDDVDTFARWMNAAMESKQVERETRKDPHYASPDYELGQAIACMQDKADQLAYDAMERPEKWEQVRKTAAHLANFAMIITLKTIAGHRAASDRKEISVHLPGIPPGPPFFDFNLEWFRSTVPYLEKTFSHWISTKLWRPCEMTTETEISYILEFKNCWNAAIDAADAALHSDNPATLRLDRMRNLKVPK